MSKQYKGNACLIVLLAGVFYLFWQLCKQQPALAHVAPFTDDPYDAVGSFGTQFAVFTALLSMVRAFRPYSPGRAGNSQQELLVRGAYLTCLSVAVTLGADVIAMIRYPSTWISLPAGSLLAALVGGMALLTAMEGWYIHHTTSVRTVPSRHEGWIKAIGISLVSTIILAEYPKNVTSNLPGELLTVILSVTLFFATVWAWGMILSPSVEAGGEDFIDDLYAIYRWLKAHAGHFSVLLTHLEKALGSSFLRPFLSWLNPRKHSWNGILLCGMCMGVALALAEAMGEGGMGPHFALLIIIFAGLEGAGVLVGYALLAKPLGLFRHDSLTTLESSYK